MKLQRFSYVWYCIIPLLTAVLFLPLPAHAQCVIINTSTQMIGNAVTILKFLANTTCTRTMNMAMTCSPTGPTMTTGLLARATAGSMNVSCGWNCGCGTVTTTGAADGLPVELLDFKVTAVESATAQP